MSHLAYPNESAEYRKARSALLAEEMALRRQIEIVAARRRALPLGGEVPEDYVLERIGENGMPEKVEMSKLFGRHQTLILYSFMYGPERDAPCPMCTHLLDSINGGAGHAAQRTSLYVVAKSPLARLVAWAGARGWAHLRFLSTAGNRYNADYFGDTSNVPQRSAGSAASKTTETGTKPCSMYFASTTARSDISGAVSSPGLRRSLASIIDPAMP